MMSSRTKSKIRDMEAVALANATGALFGYAPSSSSSSGVDDAAGPSPAGSFGGGDRHAPSLGGGEGDGRRVRRGSDGGLDRRSKHLLDLEREVLGTKRNTMMMSSSISALSEMDPSNMDAAADGGDEGGGGGKDFGDVNFDKAIQDFAEAKYEVDKRNKNRKRKLTRTVVVLGLLSCAFLLAAFVLFWPRDSSANAAGIEEVDEATKKRYEEMRFRFVHEGITESDFLERPGTPQHSALKWLATEDGAKLDVADKFLPQRYALATFWFATHDERDQTATERSKTAAEKGGEGGEEAVVQEEVAEAEAENAIASSKSGGDEGNSGGDVDTTVAEEGAAEEAPQQHSTEKEEKRATGERRRRRLGHRRVAHKSAPSTDGIGDSNDDGSLSSWTDDTNWMSPMGVCSWKGVHCTPWPNTANHDTQYNQNGMVTRLELSDNGIGTGYIPPELFYLLTDLIQVNLSGNDLGGILPPEVGNLSKLEELKLGGNDLEGSLPLTLGELSNLRKLDLSDNLLGGGLRPETLGGMTELAELKLSNNILSGHIPEEVGYMTRLEVLDLDRNELTGTLPSGLFRLTKLFELRLTENHLSGSLFSSSNDKNGDSSFGDLSLLETLHLDKNDFTGQIPSSISLCPRLLELDFTSNAFQGTLPSEYGSLSMLVQFRASGNAIGGPVLPEEWMEGMRHLQELDVSSNILTGSLPTSVANLKDLTVLSVHTNEVGGTLPSQLGECYDLQTVLLHDNDLEGTLPESLGELVNLKELTVQFNGGMHGTVPRGVCALTTEVLEVLTVDCGGTSPRVECKCCTECMEE